MNERMDETVSKLKLYNEPIMIVKCLYCDEFEIVELSGDVNDLEDALYELEWVEISGEVICDVCLDEIDWSPRSETLSAAARNIGTRF